MTHFHFAEGMPMDFFAEGFLSRLTRLSFGTLDHKSGTENAINLKSSLSFLTDCAMEQIRQPKLEKVKKTELGPRFWDLGP